MTGKMGQGDGDNVPSDDGGNVPFSFHHTGSGDGGSVPPPLQTKNGEYEYTMERPINDLLTFLDTAEAEARLTDIYEDASLIPAQKDRYKKALESFRKLFGDKPVEIYSAPGRSEVGGNHTDHQHGRVLACSLNLDFIAVVHKTEEKQVAFQSEGFDMIRMDLSDTVIRDEETGSTPALIRGVADGLAKADYQTGGFEAYVTSEVLSGSGMSSSAGLEILIGTILSGLYNDGKADSVFLAQIGQYAENVYFGKPSGLMDQMACSVGGLVSIDFADPAKPVVHPVAVDFSAYKHSLCIVDTKGSHADLTPDYAAIPEEMKRVAAFYGKEVLRDVDPAAFYKDLAVLRKKCGDRAVLRAMHFFTENDVALKEAEVLEKGQFDEFLKLVRSSGNSSFCFLQNVFTSKQPQAQGLSLGLAVSEQVLGDRGACRVHGGGFAGTIQAFVPDEVVEEYRTALDQLFGEGSCHVLKVRKYGGIRVF